MTNCNIILVGSHFRTLPWYFGLNKIGKIYFISRYKDDKSNFKIASKEEDKFINWDDNFLDNLKLSDRKTKKLIIKFEKECRYKVRDLIQADRILSNLDKSISYNYCAKIIDLTYSLFKETNFKICITEPTWAHERIILRIAKNYKCISIHPATDRFLNNAFFFFKEDRYKEIIINKYNKPENINSYIKQVKKNILSIKRINFYYLNKKRNSLNLNKFKNLIYLINFSLQNRGSRFIHYSLYRFLFMKIKNIFKNFYLTKFSFQNIDLKDICNKDVVYALQVQPEMSIDVAGYEWSNQIDTIKFLRKYIPKQYRLLIKEHPSAIGMRPRKFYHELSKIKNISIINYDLDSKYLFKKIKAVISITGTICFESHFFKIPSLTLSETYFKRFTIMKNKKYSKENIIKSLYNIEKWNVNTSDKIDNIELYNLYKNVYVGNVFDVKRSKEAISKKNILNLQKSFQIMYSSNFK